MKHILKVTKVILGMAAISNLRSFVNIIKNNSNLTIETEPTLQHTLFFVLLLIMIELGGFILGIFVNNNEEKLITKDVSVLKRDKNNEIIEFIKCFKFYGGNSVLRNEILVDVFSNGYCYYFSLTLKEAFNRGEICWLAPTPHIVWKDIDGIAYDINGTVELKDKTLIPINLIGEYIKHFKHIPGEMETLKEEDFEKLIICYKNKEIKGEELWD